MSAGQSWQVCFDQILLRCEDARFPKLLAQSAKGGASHNGYDGADFIEGIALLLLLRVDPRCAILVKLVGAQIAV